MRHTLEIRTIAALKTTPRRGSALIRDRYLKAMASWGYTRQMALDCYADVVDVAELEMAAQ